MLNLAVQDGRILHKPHVPMLAERNARQGFVDDEQLASVLAHLPPEIAPVIEFAYITGWRITSEVLPLEWRRVDFAANEIRLDVNTTKNDDGRTFPMSDRLRTLLKAQHSKHLAMKRASVIEPWVFWRMVAEGRGGEKKPRPIIAFKKAWTAACLAAGCPGRIPHDLRRSAVRNLIRAGVPERVAMHLVGHKTRAMLDRYHIVAPGDLKDAARKIDAAPLLAQHAQ